MSFKNVGAAVSMAALTTFVAGLKPKMSVLVIIMVAECHSAIGFPLPVDLNMNLNLKF